MNSRIIPIMRKEFIHIRRDPRTLALVFLMPVVQLFLFGYALSTDVKHIATALWDQEKTAPSRELVEAFRRSQYFDFVWDAENYDQIASLIDSGRAKAALVIPAGYTSKIQRGESSSVQFFLDGSDPAIASTALSYATIIAQNESIQIVSSRLGRTLDMPLDFRPRVWYNPGMESVVFNVPGLVGTILQWITLGLTAFTVVGERERGTLEQLIVTPIRPIELLVGKIVPYILIAFGDAGIALTIATLWFGMPMRGNVVSLLIFSLVFVLFSLGIGLFISTISRTQYQALQSTMFFMLPTIILSGFFFPIEAMPKPIQLVTYLVPLSYFLRIIRGLVLKGAGFTYLWDEVVVLLIFGVVVLAFSARRFHKRLE
ncbi:MAG: ABC transporter permease [Chloroflexota bacterium]